MEIKRGGAVLRQVSTLFNVGVIRDLTDGQLLERFANGQGEAAELAFAALVDRHGPMVLRVCRARLADPHDALDAFQATFLILIEKASGLWVRDSLGPWLHAVAFRTATRARSATARRRRVERLAAERPTDQGADHGWEQALHEEINRLPERYRVPIILCDLEGRTCEEAARKMGRPVGTVKSWRARARERLRQRLTRAGLAPSVGLTVVTTPEMNEAIRAVLARMTAGAVPASVGVLVKGVLKTMFIKKLVTAAAMLGTLAFAAAGVGSFARVAADDPKQPRPEARSQAAPAPPRDTDDETWSLSLREAIRIGLENWAEVRFVVTGPPPDVAFAIAPQHSEIDARRFKSAVMAVIRSIRQQYWLLSQQHVQLWAATKAVEIAEEVIKREQEPSKLGRRLDQFRIEVVNRTSDVITAERRLRNLLGLPHHDGRRIVPVTAPVEAKADPDWDECLVTMRTKQPDVLRVMETGDEKSDLDRVAQAFLPDLAADRKIVEQVIQQATHAMARPFREIDENYNAYQTAKKRRIALEKTLVAERSHHKEGRITIDTCLDAVCRLAQAVATEAQFKAMYNISIDNLEEAKGTLLEYDKITLVEHPRTGSQPGAAEAAARSLLLKASPAAIHDAPATHLEPKPSPLIPSPTIAADGRSISFQATIQIGAVPIEIRGSFTVGPKTP